VPTIGVDNLSVGGYVHDGVETHRILLGVGVWLIEGLNLAAVTSGGALLSRTRRPRPSISGRPTFDFKLR